MRALLTFDLETSGVDPHNDRIIQAFLGLMTLEGAWVNRQEWLLNPGIDIPEGAAAVHGYTTERLAAEGSTDVYGALRQIRDIIVAEVYDRTDIMLAIYNAPFDTTFLNAELRRHGLEEIDFSRILVIDPLVIDKQLFKYRKGVGSHKLVNAAPFYGVPVEENAHDAGADCLMTGRVAIVQLVKHLTHLTPEGLQILQREWKKEQSASLQTWFRTKAPLDRRDPNIVIDGSWPVQSRLEGVAA